MKNTFILSAIFLLSCSSGSLQSINPSVKLKIKGDIDSDKAILIVSQFLEAERKWNIQGVVEVSYFEEKYQRQCKRNTVSFQEYGKFCNAKYVISHASDLFCFGGSRVIESCNAGKCVYKISEYMEICE